MNPIKISKHRQPIRSKPCEICGKTYHKDMNESYAQFNARKTCRDKSCTSKLISMIQKMKPSRARTRPKLEYEYKTHPILVQFISWKS